MLAVLAELEEGCDSVPELEFDSGFDFRVGVGVVVASAKSFGEGASRACLCKFD